MVVDSSVLIAILLLEPDAEHFLNQLIDADKLDELLAELTPSIVEFDKKQADLARIAWREYGKGRHPAKLNFGDCCSYALAKHLNKPLIYKGNDFSQTDLSAR